MTRNKKFKRRVRARMEETGSGYVRARRHFAPEDPKAVYTLIGYWREPLQPYPDPMEFVDASWDPEERDKVVAYLRAGQEVRHWLGRSWCRLGCGRLACGGRKLVFFEAQGTQDEQLTVEERRQRRLRAAELSEQANMASSSSLDMGSADLSDGTYLWPEGLAHYVEKHHVRLPAEFVKHVLEEPARSASAKVSSDFTVDASWWRSFGSPIPRVRELLRRQEGDPLGLAEDPELWAGAGGVEEDRIAYLRSHASIVEVQTPFPTGWYFYDSEYPEEGSDGPYVSLEDARQAAQLVGYDLDDEDSVTFWEQRKRAFIEQRYVVDALQRNLQGIVDPNEIQKVATETLAQIRDEGRRAGERVPPDGDFLVETVSSPEDIAQKIVRFKISVLFPEKYAAFLREIADQGLFDQQSLVEQRFKEED